jgi:L-fuconolactonase
VKIDSHQHFWRYDAAHYEWIDDSMSLLRRDFLPAEAEQEMARLGFGAGVAVQARQSLEETCWLLSLADAHRTIAGVVGWVDLQADDVRGQLERFAANDKLVGIRHIVQSEPDDRFLLRPAFCRGISMLHEFGLAYDILIYHHHLPVAAEFVSRFEAQPFVLDHLAKPPIRTGPGNLGHPGGRGNFDTWKRDLARLAAFPNVMCKLSGLVTEADWQAWTPGQIRPYLDEALDCFGPDRLMIGSDWPVCTVAASYEATMTIVVDFISQLSTDERHAILGRNAQRFWNLEAENSPPQWTRRTER